MPAWLVWTLIALAAWFAISAAFGFSLARFLGAVDRSSATARGDLESASYPPPRPAARGTTASGARRRRVLVVDDDTSLRLLLRTTLAADDFEVEEVASAEEAREAARFWRPAVVILDVGLPGVDGLSFCAELVLGGNHDTIVILLTGEDISESAARLAGAKALVRKPFSPLQLMTLIDHLTDEVADVVPAPPQRADEQLLMYARDLSRIACIHQELLVGTLRRCGNDVGDLGSQMVDQGHQLERAERLAHKRFGAGQASGALADVLSGEKDHDRVVISAEYELRAEREAVHSGQADVEDDDGGSPKAGGFACLFGGGHFFYFEIVRRERRAKKKPQGRVVVNHEDSALPSAASRSATRRRARRRIGG